MIEFTRQKVRGEMTEVDQLEEAWSQSIIRHHMTEYFAADDVRRKEVAQTIDEAELSNSDVFSEILPGGSWRHRWPAGVRNAVRALWRTPKAD